MRFEPERLRAALSEISEDAWSRPSDYGQTNVHHGYRQCSLVSGGRWLPNAEPFGFVLDALAPVREAWLSRIEAWGFIVPHVDRGPWLERWQIPITASGLWLTDDETTRVGDGAAYRVEHWKPHSVVNDQPTERIHLVLDRDVPAAEDADPTPFQTFARSRHAEQVQA